MADEFKGTERYTIERRLGRGGFGVVFQALDRQQNAVVALKTLHRTGGDALFRFKREFRTLADISHPNLVTLYDLISDGRQWFFTMELVDGVDFLTYVGVPSPSTQTTLPPSDTKTLWHDAPAAARVEVEPAASGPSPCRCDPERLRVAARQLAEGLAELHRAGILHRDIKPSNVMVTREGRVVILDFGLAAERSAQGPGPVNAHAGTPAYMSPEQSAGLPIAEAADWYAVGVMLFEAFTGRRPFTGTSSQTIARKQQFDPPAPSDLATGIPAGLEALCRDLLQRDPALRPAGREVLLRLGASQTSAAEPPARAPFAGRDAQLAALGEALDAVRSGHHRVVLVHGTSGIGKSALVNRFLEEIAESGAVTFAGRCFERESVPYKAFDGVIDLLARYLKRLPAAELAEILPRDLSALVRLFPSLRELEDGLAPYPRAAIVDPKEVRQRAFAALRFLLARLGERRTLVLFIDDLQWGDADSAALLAELLHPPDPPRLLLLGCYRTEAGGASPLRRAVLRSAGGGGELPRDGLSSGESELLSLSYRTEAGGESLLRRAVLRSAANVQELALEGLSPTESERLARAISGARQLDAARAADIARDSAGNPLFIGELVRIAEPATASASLDQMIRARVARLPEPARRLMEVVAVAGRPIGFEVAKQAAQHAGADYEVMTALRGGHLVRMRAAGERQEIEAYHDRIREAVRGQLAPQIRTGCHARIAQALEASDRPDAEMLAAHFHGAGDVRKASHYAAAGAEQAGEALAFERAASLYRFALELETENAARQRDLRARLGDALGNAGRGAEAADAFLTVAQGAGAEEELEYRRRAASHLLMSGHLEQGIGVLREVLAASGMRLAATPWRALLAILCRRAWINLRGLGFHETALNQIAPRQIARIDTCWSVAQGLSLVDTIRAADFQTRHLLLALRAGEPYRVSRALAIEAGYHALFGGPGRTRAEKVLRKNRALAERIQQQHPHAIGLAAMVEGMAAFLGGRWREARDCHERAEIILRDRCRGVAWELATVRLMWSVSLFFLGELAVLADRLPGLLKEAEARGDLYEATDLRIRISHAIRVTADEPETAREEVAEAIARWPRGEFYVQHWWSLIANVEISLYAGDDMAAWELLEREWPRLKRSMLMRVQYIRIESLYHRAAAALAVAAGGALARGRRAELLAVAEADAHSILRERMQWSDPLGHLIRAGLAVAAGKTADAASLLQTAEAGFETAGMALYAAAARWRRGKLLGGEEGSKLVVTAEAWMIRQKVRNPERMTAMVAPGKWA